MEDLEKLFPNELDRHNWKAIRSWYEQGGAEFGDEMVDAYLKGFAQLRLVELRAATQGVCFKKLWRRPLAEKLLASRHHDRSA